MVSSILTHVCAIFEAKDLLSELSDEDRKIVILRYFRQKTQSETAKIIGVSQVQISRREKKILQNLRNLSYK